MPPLSGCLSAAARGLARLGGDVEQAAQAAHMAGLEPYEIAELGGVPMRRVLEILGQPED